MGKYIGVDPDRVFGLHTDLNIKINSAAAKGDELTILNLEACLKANVEQKMLNINNVLKLGYPIPDKSFGVPICEFKLKVPGPYKQKNQLEFFAQKYANDFVDYDNNITDNNFAKVSHKLIPGKIYTVKIFPILNPVSSADCIKFLNKQNAIFVGAQGVSLARYVASENFPIGKWVLSFDKEANLWEDPKQRPRFPIMRREVNNTWEFCLGYFEGKFTTNHCLLCFCN